MTRWFSWVIKIGGVSIAIVVIFFGIATFVCCVHEGGHYLAFKATGHKVERVVVGNGPVLFQCKNSEGTQFELRVWSVRSDLGDDSSSGGFVDVSRDCSHEKFVVGTPGSRSYWSVCGYELFINSAGMLATLSLSILLLMVVLVLDACLPDFESRNVILLLLCLVAIVFALDSALYPLLIFEGDANVIRLISPLTLVGLGVAGWIVMLFGCWVLHQLSVHDSLFAKCRSFIAHVKEGEIS